MLRQLLILALASSPALVLASPRPARNPASVKALVDDAAEWTFSMARASSPSSNLLVDQVDRLDDGRMRAMTTWKFEDCGLPTDAITIKSLAVDPDPPEAGKKLTIEAAGTVHTLIEEGAYADVVVKLGTYIKLLQKRFDVCEELEKANATLQCPVSPGDYTITQSVDLPKEIPKAKFTVDTRAFTQDEEDMACATIVIDFLRS